MFKKILVPLDGSDLAAQILPQVETLAKQVKAQVTLLTVGSSDTCPSGGALRRPSRRAPRVLKSRWPDIWSKPPANSGPRAWK